MKSNRYIILKNGEIIEHGDDVYATLQYGDEDIYVKGKLCINTSLRSDGRNFFVCQNKCDGDSNAEEKFGYRFSWSFMLSEGGVIISEDTHYLSRKPSEFHDDYVVDDGPKYDGAGYSVEDRDDDPMPEDWIPEEQLPKDL